jgi:hypothetical protein
MTVSHHHHCSRGNVARIRTSEPKTSWTRWETLDFAPLVGAVGLVSVAPVPVPDAAPAPTPGPFLGAAAPFSEEGRRRLAGNMLSGSSWSGCEDDGLSIDSRLKSAMIGEDGERNGLGMV